MEDDTLTLLNKCFDNLSTKDLKIANIIKQAIESYKERYVNDLVNVNTKEDESIFFINYITQNTPTWYKEGKFMNKDILFEKYEEIIGSITKPKFHNIFHQKLFGDNRRDTKNNQRFLSVRVKMYDELIKLNKSSENDENDQNTIITLTNKKVHIYTDHDWEKQYKKNFKRYSQWIYFIQDSNGIKIGLTKNLKERIYSLQTGNSCKLKLVAYIETDHMHKLEKQFHRHLKSLSIRGEWFTLDKEKMVKMLEDYRINKIQYDF